MNYMMAVDCTKEKNPKYYVCAQMVLRMMQEKGAKLSIVLLDVSRCCTTNVSSLTLHILVYDTCMNYYTLLEIIPVLYKCNVHVINIS